LRRAEMKKAQQDGTGAIAQATEQHAAPAKRNLGQFHLSFDHGLIARTQAADRYDTRTVLISKWQVKQEILQCADTKLVQLFRDPGSHTLQEANILQRERI